VAFLLTCPHCGPRDVYEFRWGGERSQRPTPGADDGTWARHLYLRRNEAGTQQEWWYHRSGCRRWFLGVRDTRSNEVTETSWPPRPESPRQAPAGEKLEP
jgi:heterotetrameric sarcosine oxidase delta subunit